MFIIRKILRNLYANIRKLEVAHYFFVTAPQKLQRTRDIGISITTVDENITAESRNGFRELSWIRRAPSALERSRSGLCPAVWTTLRSSLLTRLNKMKLIRRRLFFRRVFPALPKTKANIYYRWSSNQRCWPHFVFRTMKVWKKKISRKLFFIIRKNRSARRRYAQFCVMRLAGK